MKNLLYILAFSLFAVSCSDVEEVVFDPIGGQTSYSFSTINVDEVVLGTLEMEYEIVSSTTTQATERTFQIVLNEEETTAEPESYSLPSSVTIPANSHIGVITVTFDVNGLPDMPRRLVFDYVVPEGTALLNANEPKAIINVEGVTVCGTGDVNIAFVFDDYPQETSWSIVDENDVEVASGGDFGGMGGQSFMDSVNLAPGCYTFTIFDSFGDGICCAYGNGSYTLSCAVGSTISSGGEFGGEESTFFCVE